MILTKGGNANLVKCSSRHCLQNLWPHFVRVGSFNGKWQIAHCSSCSTSFTNSSSYPPSEGYALASAIIQRTWWVDHEMRSVESIVTCTTKCHAKPALLSVLVVSSLTEGPWGNLVPRVLSFPPSIEKVPWFRLVTCLPWANSSPPGWTRFSSRSEGKSECKSFQTGTKTEEWKSLAPFFSQTGTLKKSTVYYLRRFRSTNNADSHQQNILQ